MEAAAQMVAAQAADERSALEAERRAQSLATFERARLKVERERGEIQREIGPQVLLAIALRDLAGQLGKIDHLTVTPELLTPLLQRLGAEG
jgi:hypothetical protein